MTAINLLCVPDAVHVFTDAAHYLDNETLVGLEGKVFPLARLNAVVLFNGPSIGGPLLHDRMIDVAGAWQGAFQASVKAVEAQIGDRPFSAILVGFSDGPFGMAIEEGGIVHNLGIGSMIKALPCEINFDPDDIIGSGLAMMQNQRNRYSVVGGWCDYTRINSNGIKMEVLESWQR